MAYFSKIPLRKWQVFKGPGDPSYRFMAHPLPKQQLQLLYPGRLMSNRWHYTGENIPNENPEGLIQTKSRERDLERIASIQEEDMERYLGGKPKIAVHPAVEPEATIEDPRLQLLSIRDPINPNLEKVKSDLPSMDSIDIDSQMRSFRDESTAPFAEEVAKMRTLNPAPVSRKLREGFRYERSSKSSDCSCEGDFNGPPWPPYGRENFTLEEHRWWLWGLVALVVLLLLIGGGVIIYEATKRAKK